MQHAFQNIGSMNLQISSINVFMLEVFRQIIKIIAPLLITVIIAGIAGNVAQFGFLFTGEPLTPKFSKLDPVKGMKKIFSLKSFVELIKMVFKVSVIAGIAFVMIKGEVNTFPILIQMDVGSILSITGQMSFKICFYTSLALIIMAGLDYAFQKWQFEKDMRMTRQEVKEETKQREGDPALKARIRRAQLEMAQRRMMEAVPSADVVITNPTRLAIALKFDAKDMIAPKIVAKGAGQYVQRIKEIARSNDVAVVEHKPLAQTLFKVVEIGDFIPVNLYRAVAEILAYVYRLKGKS